MKNITLCILLLCCSFNELRAQSKPKKKVVTTTKQTTLEQQIQAEYEQRKQIAKSITSKTNKEIQKAKGYNFNPYEKNKQPYQNGKRK